MSLRDRINQMLPPQPLALWEPDPVEPLSSELQYAGHGFPIRSGDQGQPRNAWERLTRGQPLGKKVILVYDSTVEGVQIATSPILQVRGDDCDACQMTLVIAPPRIVAMPFADIITNENRQNISADQNNFEVTDDDFPGDAAPVTWAPLQMRIRWGAGGGTPNEVVVDIVNGTVVNLEASFIEVTPMIAQFDANGISGTSAAYALSAYIAPGAPRQGSPQHTTYVGDVASLVDSLVFPVPQFARRAYVVGNDPAVAPAVTVATLRFWQSVIAAGGVGASNVGNFLCTGNQFQPVDVPNGAAYFSVLNGGGATARFAVIFQLAPG